MKKVLIMCIIAIFASCTTNREIYIVKVPEYIIISDKRKEQKSNLFTESFEKADSLFRISAKAARKTNEELRFD